MSLKKLLAVALILQFFLPSSYSQLVAVECQAFFPSGGRYGNIGIYDGSDSIYIAGAIPYSLGYDIFKYSIASDEIKVVKQLPSNRAFLTMSIDTSGSIYFHGGMVNSQYGTNNIYKFIPGNINPVRAIGVIPWDNYGSIAFPKWDDPNLIYIMGGALYPEVIVAFNQTNSTSERVGLLPSEYRLQTGVSDGAGSVYLFVVGEGTTSVLKFNMTSLQIEEQVSIMEGFSFTGTPSSIWDGKQAWIIGGYGNWTTGPRPDAILKFDPVTMQSEMVGVEGFPASEENKTYLSVTNAIWVEGMKRIYFFGGYTRDTPGGDQTLHDKIWYIQLP